MITVKHKHTHADLFNSTSLPLPSLPYLSFHTCNADPDTGRDSTTDLSGLFTSILKKNAHVKRAKQYSGPIHPWGVCLVYYSRHRLSGSAWELKKCATFLKVPLNRSEPDAKLTHLKWLINNVTQLWTSILLKLKWSTGVNTDFTVHIQCMAFIMDKGVLFCTAVKGRGRKIWSIKCLNTIHLNQVSLTES